MNFSPQLDNGNNSEVIQSSYSYSKDRLNSASIFSSARFVSVVFILKLPSISEGELELSVILPDELFNTLLIVGKASLDIVAETSPDELNISFNKYIPKNSESSKARKISIF